MKRALKLSLFLFLIVMVLPPSVGFCANHSYRLTETAGVWDGTDANRNKNATSFYSYTYGDESTVTFTLPWTFNYYGQDFAAITADTNGNIWFSSTGSTHSINLASTGRGPVISAWNNDLSSYFYGGVLFNIKLALNVL